MPPPSNNKLVLKIMFVVLFLALLGELGYIFVTTNKKSTTTFVIPTSGPTIIPTKILIPVSASPSVKTPITEYQGKIAELNVIKVTPTPGANNIEFSFRLEVNDGKTKKPQIFFFDENELKLLKIIDSTGKAISYKDLKVGQNIRVNLRLIEINVLD